MHWCKVAFCALIGVFSSAALMAAEVPLTIIHTNDLHSHYRPEKGPTDIGGVARLATIIDRIRDQSSNTLLLDGGDFSEGHIYYNIGAGRASLQMMNQLGYDAVVLGNHDWYNGARVLGDVLKETPPLFRLLGANFEVPERLATEKPALIDYIKPYSIFHRGGAKIGVIGIVNFEGLYDDFAEPARPRVGPPYVRKYAAELKEVYGVDYVIVLSHNNLAFNQAMAGMKHVDLLIHAHDHERFARPIGIERNNKLALLVETGSWGRFVGRLDVVIDTKKKTWKYKNYELIQVDSKAHDHPTVATLVNNLERELERKYGEIFKEDEVELGMDLRREGNFGESVITNVMADAYRAFTGADVSFEAPKLVSGDLYQGILSKADIMNALAFIYNPLLDRTWTLKTGEMTGRALEEVVSYMAFGMQKIEMRGGSVSGIRAIYDAGSKEKADFNGMTGTLGALKSLEINGEPVKPNKLYKVALPQGILETLNFTSKDPSARKRLQIYNLVDTDVEQWEILSWYLKQNAPLNASKFSRGDRFIAVQADLALYYEDLLIRREGRKIKTRVMVRNVGLSDSTVGRKLIVGYDKTPDYFIDDPNAVYLPEAYLLPQLAAGSAGSVQVEFDLPAELENKNAKLYFALNSSENDAVHSNNKTWIISPPDSGSQTQIRPTSVQSR